MQQKGTVHDLLESDHAEIDKLLEAAIAAIAESDTQKAFRSLDYFWARLAMHIRAEHLCLFPAIRQANGTDAEILELLDRLRHDHDFFMTQLARAIKALRLTAHFGNEPETLHTVSDIVTAVRERLVEHNAIEEETVYPCVDAAADPAELAAAVRKELENYPQRFTGERGQELTR